MYYFDILQSGPVAETLAYDLLLEAAMRAQNFHSRNLRLHGPWKWLLEEFADYYEVSKSYTKLRYLLSNFRKQHYWCSNIMVILTRNKEIAILCSSLCWHNIFTALCFLCRYLSHVMDVATPTKDCLELVNELLVPIIKARSEKCLTRQEVWLYH